MGNFFWINYPIEFINLWRRIFNILGVRIIFYFEFATFKAEFASWGVISSIFNPNEFSAFQDKFSNISG